MGVQRSALSTQTQRCCTLHAARRTLQAGWQRPMRGWETTSDGPQLTHARSSRGLVWAPLAARTCLFLAGAWHLACSGLMPREPS